MPNGTSGGVGGSEVQTRSLPDYRLKWYGFFGHIQSPNHAHNARNETASLRRAFAFHLEEGAGQRAGCFRWFDPRQGYLYPARFLRLGRESLGENSQNT